MASQRIGVIMNVANAAFAIFNHFVSKPVSYFTIIIIMYIAFEWIVFCNLYVIFFIQLFSSVSPIFSRIPSFG